MSLHKRASSDLIGEGGMSQTSERKATSSPSNWGMGDADGPQQRTKKRMEEEEDGRMELIHLAIQQLLAQKRNEKKNKKEADDDDDDDEQLLSRLLLQVESVKKESAGGQSESLGGMREPSPAAVISLVETNRMSGELDVGKKESESEEMVKELKQVKWQNTVTHWLLTATMVLIAAWQFSEVKLFLKVKNKVTHPFRSVENMITGAHDALKHLDGLEHEQDAARKNRLAGLNSKSAFKVPDLPYMDLPLLGLHGGER